jgi:ribonucleotide reductase alpha subunit
MRQEIMANQGSIQKIESIPEHIREVYKTVWEMSQKILLDMAADRGPFVCQSQSQNVFFANPTCEMMDAYHFYAWSRGLKTGMYYLRTKPSSEALQMSLREDKFKEMKSKSGNSVIEKKKKFVCVGDDGTCVPCSS